MYGNARNRAGTRKDVSEKHGGRADTPENRENIIKSANTRWKFEKQPKHRKMTTNACFCSAPTVVVRPTSAREGPEYNQGLGVHLLRFVFLMWLVSDLRASSGLGNL